MDSIKSDTGRQVYPDQRTIGEALARGAIGTRQASIPDGLEEIDKLWEEYREKDHDIEAVTNLDEEILVDARNAVNVEIAPPSDVEDLTEEEMEDDILIAYLSAREILGRQSERDKK